MHFLHRGKKKSNIWVNNIYYLRKKLKRLEALLSKVNFCRLSQKFNRGIRWKDIPSYAHFLITWKAKSFSSYGMFKFGSAIGVCAFEVLQLCKFSCAQLYSKICLWTVFIYIRKITKRWSDLAIWLHSCHFHHVHVSLPQVVLCTHLK